MIYVTVRVKPNCDEDSAQVDQVITRFIDELLITIGQANDIPTPRRQGHIEVFDFPEYDSVHKLANNLDVRKSKVGHDFRLRVGHGVVTFDTDGRSKNRNLVKRRSRLTRSCLNAFILLPSLDFRHLSPHNRARVLNPQSGRKELSAGQLE